MIIAAVLWLVTLVVVGQFVGRSWRPAHAPPAGRASVGSGVRDRVLGVRDRDRLVRSGIDAIVLLVVVRALFPPPGWTSWLWVAAVVAVGLGGAGLAQSWHRLAPGRRRWPTAVSAIAGAGLVVLLA